MPASQFSEEQIEQGLTLLALFSGNASRASKELAAQGVPVSRSTLTAWRDEKYPDRYQRTHAGLVERIRERMAQQAEELSDRHAEAELLAVERFMEEAHGLSAKDASLAAKNFALARGIATDKARLLRNEPTQISEVRNVDEIIRKLSASGTVQVIEGTAVELPPRSALPTSPSSPPPHTSGGDRG